MGASQGGQQALALAGLRPDDVTAALVVVPGGCDMLAPSIGRAAGWPDWYLQTNGKDPQKVRQDKPVLSLRKLCRTHQVPGACRARIGGRGRPGRQRPCRCPRHKGAQGGRHHAPGRSPGSKSAIRNLRAVASAAWLPALRDGSLRRFTGQYLTIVSQDTPRPRAGLAVASVYADLLVCRPPGCRLESAPQ